MKTVFIVEDDPIYSLHLKNHFVKNTDFKLVFFEGGEECLARIDENPDYIILDFFLNNFNPMAMNGKELFNHIRDYNADIKIIMISGQESGELVLQLIQNGLRNYVIKDENTFRELDAIFD